MCKIEMPIPPIKTQITILKKKNNIQHEIDVLNSEITHQQTLLKKLRQAILQEAIEGKLTAEWRKQHPTVEHARDLLARIQAEKAELVKAKKIRKQKLLPPITAEEIPFPLPEGWVWCRLGDSANTIFDGPFGSNLKTKDYVDSGVRVIRLENIGALEFNNNKLSFVTQEKYETIKRHTVNNGDIIFSSFISKEIRVTVLPEYINKAINKADCFCVRLDNNKVSSEYISYFLSTKSAYKLLSNKIHGDTRPRINTTQLKQCVIPLPPLVEQKAIVAKVETLLGQCDALAEQVNAAQGYSESLLQAVLREAFRG
ncbi:restriction endonuclease subunit S [Anaerolineales bacterium HSG6]|nr:restriction endonuclease subunit S [Anaerolineales bacterium HSG6]